MCPEALDAARHAAHFNTQAPPRTQPGASLPGTLQAFRGRQLIHIYIYIPRDSLRQKFLPQIRKGAFLDLRHFFLICGVFFRIAAELVFSFFYPPICGGNRRECGGNRRECGGNSRKANGVAAFLFWLRRFFLFAADFLECGGNFRRQKFPPQEVLGIHTCTRTNA